MLKLYTIAIFTAMIEKNPEIIKNYDRVFIQQTQSYVVNGSDVL